MTVKKQVRKSFENFGGQILGSDLALYGGPSCQDRFYDFCKHILEEVISSLRREVLVALSLRRCLV